MKLNIPIYLDEEVLVFIDKIANRKSMDPSLEVNEILRGDMELAKVME